MTKPHSIKITKPIIFQSKSAANKTPSWVLVFGASMLVFGLQQRREISFIPRRVMSPPYKAAHCRRIFTTSCHKSMSSQSQCPLSVYSFTIKHRCSEIHLQIRYLNTNILHISSFLKMLRIQQLGLVSAQWTPPPEVLWPRLSVLPFRFTTSEILPNFIIESIQ